MKHPKDLDERHIVEFLTYLAVKLNVASSTQNQALCAIVFMYRHVLKKELGDFNELIYAKRPSRLPVVFTREEVRKLLICLDGTPWLLGQILYGAGLRLTECLRLRVKDIDYGYKEIVVRDGKGSVDRPTPLPEIIIEPMKRHLQKIKQLHERDLSEGFGTVYLPHALARKYINANREWYWQYVFPAGRLSIDPRSGVKQRHHADQ